MFKLKVISVFLSFILLASCGATPSYFTNYYQTASIKKQFLIEGKQTLPPFGYVDFCMREPGECPELKQNGFYQGVHPVTTGAISQSEKYIKYHPRRNSYYSAFENRVINHLQKVNDLVNESIHSVSDQEGFGVPENWRIPNLGEIGDCEDYALLKRKILIEKGWDYKYLSLAVVEQKNGEIHAVLVVRTQFGDFMLDNLEKSVKSWHKADYRWIKKQSVANPFRWVTING